MNWKMTFMILFSFLIFFSFGCKKAEQAKKADKQQTAQKTEKADNKAKVKKHRIMIVHSYNPQDICGRPQDVGIITSLKKAGFVEGENLEVERIYMDTKVKNTTPELIKAQAEMALGKVKEYKPEALVLLDDVAFKTIGLPLAKTDVQIVFSGVNMPAEEYDKITDIMESKDKLYNITGVIETIYYKDSFEMLKQIVPNAKKVLFVVDKSPVGKAVGKYYEIDKEKNGDKYVLDVDYKQVGTFEEYQQLINDANSKNTADVIFPLAVSLDSKKGRVVAPEIFKWTLQNNKKPEIGATFFFVNFGLMAGAAVDFISHGNQVGDIITHILKGGKAKDIPIAESKRAAICVNLARAEQLKIKIPQAILEKADKDKIYKVMKMFPEYKYKGN